MKKRILSCFTALALCLTLLPATALAADGESSTEPHTHSDWLASSYGTDAKTLVLCAGGDNNTGGDPLEKQGDGDWNLPAGNYYLKGNITVEYAIAISGVVTICLNGKTIESSAKGQPVFRVEDGSTLTLTDCQNNKGKVKHTGDGSGSGVRVEGGGTFNMNGGTITGNKAETGGGVYVVNGTFTMNGGTISGNTANSTDGGVGVYTTDVSSTATFTMNGGTISGNNATKGGGVGVYRAATFEMNNNASVTGNTAKNGGGVYVDNKGVPMDGATFKMNDGTISGNTASGDKADQGNGGGVYVYEGKFEMNDTSSITDNTATNNKPSETTYGGGVYVNNSGTFTMNGNASITGNTATNGGGVYVSKSGTFNMNGNASIKSNIGNGVCVCDNARFTVSDAPIVTGNTMNSADSNVYLTGSAYITIGDYGLHGSAGSIGVTKGAGIDIAKGSKDLTEDDAAKFKSDKAGYAVSVDTKNKKQLVLKKEETQPSTHKHEWTYEANGAIITATCNGTGVCDVNNSFVTITPPELADLIYNGMEKHATVERSKIWKPAFPETIVISYYELAGSSYVKMENGAPTKVGKYMASITVKGATASVVYEILNGSAPAEKTDPTYTAPTAKSGLVYTGENQPLIAPGSTNHGRMWYKLGTDDV